MLFLGLNPVFGKGPISKSFILPDNEPGILTVRIVDVGKGDAIVLQLPDGKTCLIDTGYRETADKLMADLHKWNIQTIDLILLTHPDKDHIGGYGPILEQFIVKETLIALDPRDPDQKARVKAGMKVLSGKNYEMKLVAPRSLHYKDVNDYSMVARLTFGDVSFLFAGDVLQTSQEEMLAGKTDLRANVLKVPHHGRFESTSEAFIKAVHPEYAIITCNEKNGEKPDKEILTILSDLKCQVLRSDENGNIRFRTDGKILEMKP